MKLSDGRLPNALPLPKMSFTHSNNIYQEPTTSHNLECTTSEVNKLEPTGKSSHQAKHANLRAGCQGCRGGKGWVRAARPLLVRFTAQGGRQSDTADTQVRHNHIWREVLWKKEPTTCESTEQGTDPAQGSGKAFWQMDLTLRSEGAGGSHMYKGGGNAAWWRTKAAEQSGGPGLQGSQSSPSVLPCQSRPHSPRPSHWRLWEGAEPPASTAGVQTLCQMICEGRHRRVNPPKNVSSSPNEAPIILPNILQDTK